jgi:peptide/nickel transport system permease protein
VFRFILRRLGASALLLYLVLTSTFFFIHLAPGEPIRLYEDPRIPVARQQELRQAYGLDRPLVEQYTRWFLSVAQGNWGTSFTSGRPATRILSEKFLNSLVLVLAAVFVEHILGISLGIVAAARANSFLDAAIRAISLALFAIPSFVLALLAIEILTVYWPLFPGGQMRSDQASSLPFLPAVADLFHHLFLPAVVLGLARFGGVVRYVRNGLLETLGQDYIRTARAKGMPPWRVLWVHALRNTLTPLVQRLGVALPLLFSSILIVEVIFSWPGIGSSMFLAVQQRDYPVVLASTALAGGLVVTGTLFADLLHAFLDPRVRNA